jgi:hypothetical protein
MTFFHGHPRTHNIPVEKISRIGYIDTLNFLLPLNNREEFS